MKRPPIDGMMPKLTQAREEAEKSREDAEGFVVSNLEKLRQGHRPRFAKAIDDKTTDRNDQCDRRADATPPREGKA